MRVSSPTNRAAAIRLMSASISASISPGIGPVGDAFNLMPAIHAALQARRAGAFVSLHSSSPYKKRAGHARLFSCVLRKTDQRPGTRQHISFAVTFWALALTLLTNICPALPAV